MKRVLVLLAIPVALLAIWGAGRATDQATAKVDISAPQVGAMRGTVITQLEALGATRISETTSFNGDGSSDIVFRLPAARIEQALVQIDQLGGTVTDQRVDLRAANDRAASIGDRLGSAQSCLEGAAGELRNSVSAARSALGRCQTTLRDAATAVNAAPVAVDDAQLEVTIHPVSGVNGLAILVAVILLTGVIVMTVLLVRSRRKRDRVDLRSDPEIENPLNDDELYQWN